MMWIPQSTEYIHVMWNMVLNPGLRGDGKKQSRERLHVRGHVQFATFQICKGIHLLMFIRHDDLVQCPLGEPTSIGTPNTVDFFFHQWGYLGHGGVFCMLFQTVGEDMSTVKSSNMNLVDLVGSCTPTKLIVNSL
jgi:hypothetical protein